MLGHRCRQRVFVLEERFWVHEAAGRILYGGGSSPEFREVGRVQDRGGGDLLSQNEGPVAGVEVGIDAGVALGCGGLPRA
ncbi:hypothetical protein C1I95_05045 [Micromonospora craterilacus]|uniref:Uncharacterized protein n=1 Tax=Micromonospora craterilacus TaxID=1655439 RepID=A0A2W2F2S8_9ACTN|nr:hypothetical protein C1I95_05045 [Micromonospora craterilacus]